MSSALQEMGLKLQPARHALNVIVVDHMEGNNLPLSEGKIRLSRACTHPRFALPFPEGRGLNARGAESLLRAGHRCPLTARPE